MKNPLTLDELSKIAERIRGIEPRTRTDQEVLVLLARLNGYQLSLGTVPDHQRCWVRACRLKEDEELSDLHRLIYPSTPAQSVGRANLANQSVLYAASNSRVALDEINAHPNDRIGEIVIRQRPDRSMPLMVIGEIEAILNSGKSIVGSDENIDTLTKMIDEDREDLEKAQLADAVMAQLFRRAEKHYQATALHADQVYRQEKGVIYPSVRTQWGTNLALLGTHFNTHYEVVSAAEIRLQRHYGNSLYSEEIVKSSSAFSRDGLIDWRSGNTPTVEWTIQSGVNFPESFVGWRVSDD